MVNTHPLHLPQSSQNCRPYISSGLHSLFTFYHPMSLHFPRPPSFRVLLYCLGPIIIIIITTLPPPRICPTLCTQTCLQFRPSLLSTMQQQILLPLSSRRKQSKLILLLNNICHYPSSPLLPKPTSHHSLRNCHGNNFLVPSCHTSSYKNSFFPSSISPWNSLPPHPKETLSLSYFKHLIK